MLNLTATPHRKKTTVKNYYKEAVIVHDNYILCEKNMEDRKFCGMMWYIHLHIL